jgi:hypothetical protein
MKKVLTICAVAAMLTFVGSADTAKADDCSSGGFSGFSFGLSRPSYYSVRPSYQSYYRTPSYGYGSSYGYGYSRPSVYSRPGFSISFGSGYRSSSFGHSHHNHGFRSYNRSLFHRH